MAKTLCISLVFAITLAGFAGARAEPAGETEPSLRASIPEPEPIVGFMSGGADGAWEQLPTRHPPRGVSVTGTVLDRERDRLLFLTADRVWSLGLSDGLWQRLPVRGAFRGAPAGIALFDSVRDEVLIVGGDVPGATPDVWSLDLQRDLEWRPLSMGGSTMPSARRGAAGALDPRTRSIVVFGGHDGSQWRNDTWVLDLGDPPHWTRLDISGAVPMATASQKLVYDARRNRMLLIADPVAGGPAETWELSREGAPSWRRLDTIGTAPIALTACVVDYDPDRDWIWVDGGSNDVTSDVFTLSLTDPPTWSSQGGVLRRWNHGGAYDTQRHGLIVALGGTEPEYELYSHQTGVSVRGPGNPTVPFLPTGVEAPEPGENAEPIACFDPITRSVKTSRGFEWWTRYYSENAHEYLYSFPYASGVECEFASDPLFEWRPFSTQRSGPSLSGMAWAYDSRRQRVVCFGGSGACGPYGCSRSAATWELNLSASPPKWRDLGELAGSPPGRIAASAVYDSVRDRVLLVGGYVSFHFWEGQLVDRLVWSLDRATNTWSNLPTSEPPAFDHRVHVFLDVERNRLIAYGSDLHGSSWELSLDSGEWKALRRNWTDGATGRYLDNDDAVTFDPSGRRLLVLHEASHAIGSLSVDAPYTWSWLDTDGAPPQRAKFRRWVVDPVHDVFWLIGGTPPTALSLFRPRRSGALVEHGSSGELDPRDRPVPVTAIRFLARAEAHAARIELEISGQPAAGGVTRFELYDLQGRRLSSVESDGRGGQVRRAQIETTALPSGVYLTRAITGGQSFTRRVAVLH